MRMRKILLSIVMAFVPVLVFAQKNVYTDNLVVVINGESLPSQEAEIVVQMDAEGRCTLLLKNFVLNAESYTMPIGNIMVADVLVTEENGVKNFSAKQDVYISVGDDTLLQWMGPMISPVPIELMGKMTDEKLYCTIDIDMTMMKVAVVFGSDFTATSLSNIEMDKEKDLIYDITGRKVDCVSISGLYIVNGKKYYIRK